MPTDPALAPRPASAETTSPTRMLVLRSTARHAGRSSPSTPSRWRGRGRSPSRSAPACGASVAEASSPATASGQRRLSPDDGLAALRPAPPRSPRPPRTLPAGSGTAAGAWRPSPSPRPDTAARDALREHLGRLGGAAIHNGLYASPHPWEKAVADEAERLDVSRARHPRRPDDLTVGGVSEPTALAARLWPIERLAARYQSSSTAGSTCLTTWQACAVAT